MPRAAAVAAALLALAVGGGCATYNPGYFPYWIPGGRVEQTHAKPRGRGAIHDFDPKASRLEVTPGQANNPLKTQQLIVATVFDKDGQPRRGRRVEFMLEGPGSIIEVDETGWTAGRGYKVGTNYAVGYTSYREQVLTRGTPDKGDDATVQAGQTWCIVSSAVPGETVVRVYAPEIFNSAKNCEYVRLSWGDNQFTFPPPSVVKYGGEVDLSTVINRLSAEAGVTPNDIKVRYRVAGGPQAEFIPLGTQRGARAGQPEMDVTADPDGKAGVRLVQPLPRPGKTNVIVEILKNDPTGVGVGQVVGRTTTSVEWAAPQLALAVKLPKVAAQDRELPVTMTVTNTGPVETSPVTIRAGIPEGLELLASDPQLGRQFGREKAWAIGALAPGGTQEVRLTMKPTRKGGFTLKAVASTDDGLRSESTATTEVGTAAMKVVAEPVGTISVGQRATVRVVVTNPSSVALENAVVWLTVPPGLEHDTGNATVEATVGTLPAGQSKPVDIPLIARQAGKFNVAVNVTADGQLSEKAAVALEVRKADLKVTLGGPDTLAPGSDGTYEVRVTNPGEVALPNVTVRLSLPPALMAKSATDEGKVSGRDLVLWTFDTLSPGERKSVRVSVTADRAGGKDALAVAATSDSGVGKGLTAKAETPVRVVGKPALVLELADPRESVPVGRRAQYRIRVTNKGTGPATDVTVSADIPDEYANARGATANGGVVRTEGNKITFPTIPELKAGESVTVTVDVEGAKTGTARMRAEVKAGYLSQPLQEEQATRVVGR